MESEEEKKRPEIKEDQVRVSESNDHKNIKEVWRENVDEEFRKISRLLDEGYTWVAMDTEFPGIVINSCPE